MPTGTGILLIPESPVWHISEAQLKIPAVLALAGTADA